MYAVNQKENSGAQEIVNAWVKQHIPEYLEVTGIRLIDYFTFDDDKAVFKIEDWKWYPDYPEVNALEGLFKEFTDTFCKGMLNSEVAYAIEFVRFGEDYTDAEVKMSGNAQYRLELHRTIYID
jgi:hypothetical protein